MAPPVQHRHLSERLRTAGTGRTPGLVPRRCVVCARLGTGLCPGCAASLPPAPACDRPPGVDRCCGLLAHTGAAARLVAGLKYRNHRDALGALGESLAVLADALDATGAPVTWAPTSRARARARGFDQSELLARSTARAGGRRCRPLLRRRPGPPQTGLDRAGRLAGPSFDTRGPVPHTVILVDDVLTTGATLSAAATALRAAGAAEVLGLVLAVHP